MSTMAGRKNPKVLDEHGDGSPRSPKAVRGFARGHGAHHRPGKGAPRPLATGRGREAQGPREHAWRRMTDDRLADLAISQKWSASGRRVEATGQASGYGAPLTGTALAATVVEVRRGGFLVALSQPPEVPPGSPPLPLALRTVLRGTLQQFDLGLTSLVAAGDEVEVVVPTVQGDEEYEAVLARVLPRRSEFRRLHPSGRSVQTIAANAALVVVVASTAEPDFRPGFVDRVLVCAAVSDLPALLVLNKADLGVSEKDRKLLEVYHGLGVRVIVTSAQTGAGLDELRAALQGRRAALCGHSGVGKSSLLIALAPELAGAIRVGEVSTQTHKGAHTTTHARLYRVGGGEVIDTPGVREFTPADTDRKNLWAWFPELAARQGQCAFADCTHRVEKGCAVLRAVEAGEIHPRRHESYVRIYETLPV